MVEVTLTKCQSKRRNMEIKQDLPLFEVESSNIAAIGYDGPSKTLRIKFREKGRIYDYLDVPLRKYCALMQAESKGTYFAEQIKPIYKAIEIVEVEGW